MDRVDFRVYDLGQSRYVVGATATASWQTGSSTDVSTAPLGKITWPVPADETAITIDITANGYCPYHEDNRPVIASGGWTYLYVVPGC
jgi:hypothetical protein